MNNITVTGNVARSELKHLDNGTALLKFSLADNKYFKGEQSTQWFTVDVWGNYATAMAPYVVKGVKIAVAGELELKEYEGKNGKSFQANINARNLDIMKKSDDQQQNQNQHRESTNEEEIADDVPF